MAKNDKTKSPQVASDFPPVVAVLGHVDHGKTSLLDAIRKTSVATREHGGITQSIGASSIEILHDKQKRRITFIDTPGHEAFSMMRGRGAMAADIGLLIVSAVDGIMPQTKESITLLKEAKIPFIVVFTKSDLPTKNVEKTKQQLQGEDILLEGLGGDTPYIEVSSKTGHNIKELLELILLVSEVHDIFKDKKPSDQFKAVVIESKLDQRVGAKATVIVKNGTISVREDVVCDDQEARIRSLIDDKSKQQPSASIGDAVEIFGFQKVPPVGSIVYKKAEAELTIKEPAALLVEEPSQNRALEPHDDSEAVLSLILCADTLGALEAIINAIPKEINIMVQKTGEISEADILLAKSVKAIVLGFNTKLRTNVVRLAEIEKVLLKNYTIIYELIEEVKDVLEGKQLSLEEKIYGVAKILATFPFEKTTVLGIKVLEGRVAKGDRIRVVRGKEETLVGESHIISVRQGKNVVSKAEKGNEAGIIISPVLDFILEDVVICHD